MQLHWEEVRRTRIVLSRTKTTTLFEVQVGYNGKFKLHLRCYNYLRGSKEGL